MENALAHQYSKGTPQVGAAALGGFLKGISYLNQDRRSNFAEAFLLKEVDEDAILRGINAVFHENPIPPFVVRDECEITIGKLEQDLSSSILFNSHITDSGQEKDLGAYISFKVMDRIDDILELQSLERVKKLTGSFGNYEGIATFYCLTNLSHTLVIYLFTRTQNVDTL